jgi:ferredoxin
MTFFTTHVRELAVNSKEFFMAAATHPITLRFKEHTKVVPLRHGLGLQVLGKDCPWLEFDCRKADCGICIVRVKEGAENLSPPTTAEADFLKAMHAAPDERLACQCRAFGPLTLEIDDYT